MKFLSKNEIREDLNPNHKNKHGKNHNAYITVKYGHKYKANTITYAEYVKGEKTLDLEKGLPNNKKHKRISPPFWQNEKQFGKKLKGKIPKKEKSKIKRFNRKYEKKQKK